MKTVAESMQELNPIMAVLCGYGMDHNSADQLEKIFLEKKILGKIMDYHKCSNFEQLDNMLETANKAMENQLSKIEEKTENPSRGLSLFNWGR